MLYYLFFYKFFYGGVVNESLIDWWNLFGRRRAWLGMWLLLFFKVFFVPKCIKMMFFYYFKNYFWDQRIKTIQNTQKKLYILEFLRNAVCTAFPNGVDTLQDLTVLPTEFFRRRKTHIPSVINLPTESQTEMLRRWIFRR
jgi:hypothetical protein